MICPEFTEDVNRFLQKKSNLLLNIEIIIRSEVFILDTSSSYLLLFDWFISNGIECYMGVGYERNPDEKYYIYRRVSVTGREIFKR